MKKIKICASSLIALLLSLSLCSLSSAAPVSESSSVLLKLNQYYVAYTAPRAPYVDANNRFMIPLRSIADLTAARAAYNPSDKSVTLTRKNSKEKSPYSTLKVALRSKEAVVNGTTVSMDTEPVMLRGSVFVPLGVVAKAFGLGLEWDPTQRLTTLREDPAYLPSGIVMDELYFLGQHTSSSIQPIRSKVEVYQEKGYPLARFHLTVQNQSSDKTKTPPYLHIYVQDSGFRWLDLTRDKNVEPGGTLTFDTENTILADSLSYVLVEPCQ